MGEIDRGHGGHGQWASRRRYDEALALQVEWEDHLAWESSEEGLRWVEACPNLIQDLTMPHVPKNTPADDADLRRSPGDHDAYLGLVAQELQATLDRRHADEFRRQVHEFHLCLRRLDGIYAALPQYSRRYRRDFL